MTQLTSKLNEIGFTRHPNKETTLDEAANYLRDVHGLHCSIDCTLDWSKWYITIHDKSKKMWGKGFGSFDTYALAQSEFVTKAIEIVKGRGYGK